MFLQGAHSGLIQLHESLRSVLGLCAKSSWEMVELMRPYMAVIAEINDTTNKKLAGQLGVEDADSRIGAAEERIPQEVLVRSAQLRLQEVPSLALSGILFSCFCLESYINSLAYFLFKDADFLSLVRNGHKGSADVLLDAIWGMTIRDKWQTIGSLRDGNGFDKGTSPYQDFIILFRFRDERVHDKVTEWVGEETKKRYNNRLPESVLLPVDLGNALFAAETYWNMVHEIHRLIGVPMKEFQRYMVPPWSGDGHRDQLKEVARQYRDAL